MTGRNGGSNALATGVARLVAGAGRGMIDTVLDLATSVRAQYPKDEPPRIRRPAEWWSSVGPAQEVMGRSGGGQRRAKPKRRS